MTTERMQMRRIIKEGECGVLWKKGKITDVLKPGSHRYTWWFGERLDIIEVRPVDYLCQTQEYTTKDNMAVRFFIRANVRVSDAAQLMRSVEYLQLNSKIQNTLSDAARKFVMTKTLDELLENSANFSEVIFESSTDPLKAMGLQLETISPVSILLPRSLKQAYEAMISAQKRSQADLEEARGRTATLRHLANAADIVEKRPILLQLLLGQKARNVQFQFNEKDKK